MAQRRHWLVSPSFDVGWFLIPGLAAALLAAMIAWLAPAQRETHDLALWIVGVVLVDVAHVWASLYRTWLDPEARTLHAERLRWAPVIVGLLSFMVFAVSPRLFWGVLAYFAVFHFIKQQIGFVALYLRAGDQGSSAPLGPHDQHLAKAAIWAATAGPVIYWHSRLPREFQWFVADDFIAGLPAVVGDLALWIELAVLVVFAGRWLKLGRRGHPMVPLIVGTTALCWNLGIVCFNDDRVFTITNIFLHGVPYMALVWVTGGRRRAESVTAKASGMALALFYGSLVVLAWAEEAAWDRLVWHDHELLFGTGGLALGELGLALVVAVLTVPQATHYFLDRWIWRVGPLNPRLAGELGFRGYPPPDVP